VNDLSDNIDSNIVNIEVMKADLATFVDFSGVFF